MSNVGKSGYWNKKLSPEERLRLYLAKAEQRWAEQPSQEELEKMTDEELAYGMAWSDGLRSAYHDEVCRRYPQEKPSGNYDYDALRDELRRRYPKRD
jgi:hypothetical protein